MVIPRCNNDHLINNISLLFHGKYVSSLMFRGLLIKLKYSEILKVPFESINRHLINLRCQLMNNLCPSNVWVYYHFITSREIIIKDIL